MIYTATSPWQSFFKVGFWTGSVAALEAQHKAYYGPELQLRTWPCDECRLVEKDLLAEFAQFSRGGNLLDTCCLTSLTELLDLARVA